MSDTTKKVRTQNDRGPESPKPEAAGSTLTSTRENTDRLFAAASKTFMSLTQDNSHEFLRRSRQTGGQ